MKRNLHPPVAAAAHVHDQRLPGERIGTGRGRLVGDDPAGESLSAQGVHALEELVGRLPIRGIRGCRRGPGDREDEQGSTEAAGRAMRKEAQ